MERGSSSRWWLVAGFLSAVVAANLLVSAFGQIALVYTAWVLIPLDMLTRDLLHERWRGDRLALRMGLLLLAGGVLTVAVNIGAWRVALAGTTAFTAAMLANGLVFERLASSSSRYTRMNTSNAAAAVIDSLLFPLIAFGGIDPALSAAQASSKFAGGLVWSAVAVWAVPAALRYHRGRQED